MSLLAGEGLRFRGDEGTLRCRLCCCRDTLITEEDDGAGLSLESGRLRFVVVEEGLLGAEDGVAAGVRGLEGLTARTLTVAAGGLFLGSQAFCLLNMAAIGVVAISVCGV